MAKKSKRPAAKKKKSVASRRIKRKAAAAAVTFDYAEYIALRNVVMTLVGVMADRNEKLYPDTSKDMFIERFAEVCLNGIQMAAIDGPNPEGLRSAAIEHVKHILGGIIFTDDTGAD
jgi:hypothetical protein